MTRQRYTFVLRKGSIGDVTHYEIWSGLLRPDKHGGHFDLHAPTNRLLGTATGPAAPPFACYRCLAEPFETPDSPLVPWWGTLRWHRYGCSAKPKAGR